MSMFPRWSLRNISLKIYPKIWKELKALNFLTLVMMKHHLHLMKSLLLETLVRLSKTRSPMNIRVLLLIGSHKMLLNYCWN